MIDTHTHIYGFEDRLATVERAMAAGVEKILLPNCDCESLEEINSLCAEKTGVCYAMYGVHPTEIDVEHYREQLDEVVRYAMGHREQMVAVGEIGIDLYWSKEHEAEQRWVLDRQIDWAIELGLPVSYHVRNAYAEFFDVLKDKDPMKIEGVIHCFSGTEDDARYIMERYPKLYFGFNGTVTYKNSLLPNVAKLIGLERIVLETDAPYLSPVPLRGKRNEPSNLTYVRSFLAGVFECEESEIDQVTTENAKKCFGV